MKTLLIALVAAGTAGLAAAAPNDSHTQYRITVLGESRLAQVETTPALPADVAYQHFIAGTPQTQNARRDAAAGYEAYRRTVLGLARIETPAS